MRTLPNISSSLLNFLFPKKCEWCGDPFVEGLSNLLCRPCFDSIVPYEDPVCEGCGVSLPARSFEDALTKRCRDCGDPPRYVDQVRAFGPYGGPLRIAHHAFKFEGMQGIKKEVASKMRRGIPGFFWDGVQVLVPVPLSPERERERGYNPAFLLADELSRECRIPGGNLLRKIRSTPPQMSLNRDQRIQNPKGVYQVTATKELPAKAVLVDDVLTTGSTLEECARVLKKAGVQWVGAVVFGRTPRY